MRVVGLVGLQGAGKTEVARVALSLGIPCIRMGEAVIEETRRRGLQVNEENVGRVADLLRERMGRGAVAKLNLPLIREKLGERGVVVVDGLRSPEEVEEFRKAFGEGLVVVAVWANPRLRYSRVLSRGREDDARSYESFLEKDRRELRWGVGEVLSLADHLLLNEGSLEELREKALELFRGLLAHEDPGQG